MTLPVGSIAAYFDLHGISEFERGIVGAQRDLNLTGESATRMAAATDKADAALSRAGRAASTAAGGAAKLRAAQLSAVAATERFNTLLADETTSVARLASAEASMIRANQRLIASSPAASIRATATAADETAGAMARARSRVAGFAETAAKLGLGLAGFEAAIKAVELVKAGADFQRTMLLIQTNANASTAEVKNMSAAVLGLAGKTATAPIELANALYHVEQNGLRGQEALDALRIGAEGAKVGMADVEETTNAMTFAIASGIKGVSDMDKAMGFLIATVGTGDMRMSDLNEALGTGILSVAKQFGASLADVSAVLATLGDNGIRGADAATGLRQVLMGFAKPAKEGADALASVHLSMTDLRDAMEKHGLIFAMNDLSNHMKAAGVTGDKAGAFITNAFGRKAGASLAVLIGEMDRVNRKLAEVQDSGDKFASKWQATTQTVSFAFKRLEAEAQTAGIEVFEKLGPPAAKVASILADDLPAALGVVGDALHPFAVAWGDVSKVLGPVGHGLEDIAGVLKPVGPAVKDVAVVVLSMWLAWKGFGVAWAASNAVQDAAVAMGAKVKTAAATVTGSQERMASEATVTARVMQAEFAQIEASALQAAAAQDKAAALEAQAFADQTAASKAATDAQVADADARAAAALGAARASATAATVATAAAEESATAIAASGEAARLGWAGIAGPLGLAAVGVLTLVSLFHKSSTASKEATDAAKAYADALQAGSGDLKNTIIGQLADTNVPQEVDALNKALGSSKFTATEFATAIEKGGKPLDNLKTQLEALVHGGSLSSGKVQAALALMGDLVTQYDALSKAARKDLADTKAFAGVSSSVDKISVSTKVASDTAKQYAQMMGIAVDKNGIAAVSSRTLATAVSTVSKAYNTATQTGSGFLDALKTFSGSAGVASDRAALIGSTLKAANGDALGFAAAMTGATSATSALTDAFASQSQQLAQQGADQEKAAGKVTSANRSVESAQARVAAAQARLNAVRANSKATTAQLKSAEASLTSAQNSAANAADKLATAQSNAGQAGALAYADTERAALKFKHTADGLVASINTTAKGAGDLVSQLQGIQSAAVSAAGAMYQHELATKGAKQAADDAYNIYKTETSGQLVDEHKKLGLTKKEAQALGKAYFDMPKTVKTLIEAEGTNPIVTVLNKIGQQLAYLTHRPWNTKINVEVNTRAITAAQHKIDQLVGAGKSVSPALTALATNSGHRNDRGLATGGPVGGSGAKGVDSQLRMLAPGEWVISDKAVDALNAKYGTGVMAAINRGVLPSSPASSGPAHAPAAPSMDKSVTVKHFEQKIYNPLPEKASDTSPAGLRRMAMALGRR